MNGDAIGRLGEATYGQVPTLSALRAPLRGGDWQRFWLGKGRIAVGRLKNWLMVVTKQPHYHLERRERENFPSQGSSGASLGVFATGAAPISVEG